MFNYLLKAYKRLFMTDDELEDLPLFLKRPQNPLSASDRVVQAYLKPDEGTHFDDSVVDLWPSTGLSEQSKKRTKTVKFQKYDDTLGRFVEFERTFEVYDSKPVETPYYKGFLAFAEKDLLSLDAGKLFLLCPYKGICYNSTEFWRGWYSAARWYWYDSHKDV